MSESDKLLPKVSRIVVKCPSCGAKVKVSMDTLRDALGDEKILKTIKRNAYGVRTDASTSPMPVITAVAAIKKEARADKKGVVSSNKLAETIFPPGICECAQKVEDEMVRLQEEDKWTYSNSNLAGYYCG